IFFVEGKPYPGGVFYAKDAFEGLEILNILNNEQKAPSFYEKIRTEAEQELLAKPATDKPKEIVTTRSSVQPREKIPTPPFLGIRVLENIDLREVFPLMDFKSLFRLSWGIQTRDKTEFDKLLREKFNPLLDELEKEVLREKWFEPKVLYGFYPAQSEGNSIHIFDPVDKKTRLTSFTFPRQSDKKNLCLADYLQPIDSGKMDVLAFHVVTLGEKISQVCEALQAKSDYSRGYYLHGLSVETTEGLATWIHQKIRQGWGLKEDEGKRYSFGYPACPEMEDQGKLFSILKPEEKIGVVLTEAFQMVPEQSTSALIFHHPEATYFGVKNR
ncbi:MAG: vitamin B12 dependent-methionine synthase activation domain-containing protein, partial [bacterium]|nr:vitamin B12 dependent-methionine synthase activation domain-containing protein [bacterium]